MIALILFVFFLVLFVSLFPIKFKAVSKTLIFVIAIILIFVAGLRNGDATNDYYMYLSFWGQQYLSGSVESSFISIRDILKNILGLPSVYLFLTYALVGVSTKLFAISKLSPFPFLAILLYIGHYYILHEMTQIRIGAASGFFLIAIYYKVKKNLPLTIIFVCLSIYFHYSAFVGLIILLLNKRSNKLFYFLVPLGYLLFFVNQQFNLVIPIPYFQEKMEAYTEMKKWGVGDKINVFNFVFLTRILLLYFLFFMAKTIYRHNKNIYLFLKIYAISIFSFLLLADNPAFSFRIQEFLGVVEIVLLPLIAFSFPQKFWGKFIVVIIAFSFLLIDIFYNKYILT